MNAPWKPEQFRLAAPVGYKLCRTCPAHILSYSKHARCENCRKATPKPRCKACGKPYAPRNPHQRHCSQSCGRKA